MQCAVDGTTLGVTERFGLELSDGERNTSGGDAHGERKKASRLSVLTGHLGGGE